MEMGLLFIYMNCELFWGIKGGKKKEEMDKAVIWIGYIIEAKRGEFVGVSV